MSSGTKHGIVTVSQQPVGVHPAVLGTSSGSGHASGRKTGSDAPDLRMEAGAW